MKVLAIKWRALGDTVLWTGALEALAHHIGCPVDIATDEKFIPLFDFDTRIGKKIGLSDKFLVNISNVRQIHREKYDCILNFHASHRSLLVSLFARAPKRLIHHHSRRGRNFFSSLRIEGLGIPAPALERDLNVVRTLGWSGKAPSPKILCPPSLTDQGKNLLTKSGWKINEPLIVLGIGASRFSKNWGLERFAKLSHLLEGMGRIGVLYEFPNQLADSMKDWFAPHTLFLHTPFLSQLMGTLSNATVYVGSDSGVKHLACALGIKTLTLFGPESVSEWHCYSLDRHRVIQKPVLCRDRDADNPTYSWCGFQICPYASHACMGQILPEEVESEVRQLLV